MFRRTIFSTALAIGVLALFAFSAGAATTPQLAVGTDHTCALEANGTVKCFGNNDYGQLGNSTNTGTITPNPTPTTVDLGGSATDISAGNQYTCALMADQSVKCFGNNEYGQLGNSTNTGTGAPNPTPTTVDLGGSATDISAGYRHTCALMADQSVKCFGYNYFGQLGTATNNSNFNPNPTPTTVDLGGPAVGVSAGGFHTCALMADQSLKCFGYNEYGQLGNATNNGGGTPNPTPTTVDLGGPAVGVSAGLMHTCALMADRGVKCFGSNGYGQLGNATNSGIDIANPTPTTVDIGGPALGVSSGEFHTCVLMADQSVKCFGRNRYGQLGNATNSGTNNASTTPTTVALPGAAKQVAASGNSTCVWVSPGSAYCFGYNRYGQVGNATNNNTNNPSPSPTLVASVDLTPASSPAAPSGPTTLTGRFIAPKWKTKKSGKKLKLTANLVVSAEGMTASHCSGKVMVSVKPRRRTGGSGGSGRSGGSSTVQLFNLSYVNGACSVAVARTIPARFTRRGVKLTISFSLFDSPLLKVSTRKTTPKLAA